MGSSSAEGENQDEPTKWSLFGQRFRADTAALRKPPFRQAAPAILVRPGTIFTGQIEALRVVRYGRFGNNFYQILNAAMLAQRMGCTLLEIPEIDRGPARFPVQVDTVGIVPCGGNAQGVPALSASFYWPAGLETTLGAYDAEFADQTIDRYMRPLYKAYHDPSVSRGDDTLVVNFRGGDVFAPNTYAIMYVQPPASFYIKSIEYARCHLGITNIHLVYEDKANPSVDTVLNHLSERGIPHSCQASRPNSKVFDDATALMSARHLVASYSTFCEAAALLSTALKSYVAFRRVVSQRFIPFWAQSRFEDLLRAKGVRTIVIDDPDRSYIKEETWLNTPDQLALMRDYPIEKLHVREGR